MCDRRRISRSERVDPAIRIRVSSDATFPGVKPVATVNCSERVDPAIWIRVSSNATFPGVKPVATVNRSERVDPATVAVRVGCEIDGSCVCAGSRTQALPDLTIDATWCSPTNRSRLDCFVASVVRRGSCESQLP